MKKVTVVLAIMALPFFSNEAAAAETTPHQGVARPQKQPSLLLAQTDAAAGRPDPSPGDHGHRIVRVGIYENKPKIYTDETGAAAGIFAAILAEIARQEKWQVTYVPCTWFECLESLKNGRIDLMPDVAFSAERDDPLDFHAEEVVCSWSTVYAKNREHMNTVSDLNGRRIAVLKGSIQQTFLEQLARGFGFRITFIEAESFEEAYLLAAAGTADAVVSNHLFGDYFHQQYGLAKTPIVFNPVSLYFATASGANPDLLAAIDHNLKAMKSEPGSAYYRTLQRWMEKPPQVLVPPYLLWIISGISGLLILALAFILLLRWQLGVRTRHLADANKMLSDSEKKFRDLFHHHAAVKLLIDPDTGNIVEANEAAEKFYGWPRERLRQMRITDINILSPEQVKAEMEKAKNMQRIHFEFRHRLADGSIRDVAVFSSRIDMEGKILLHSIIHDITAHRHLEDQLRQAQKMESVGRLAGGVAHDYNNMLSVILGYTELALDRTDPANPLHDYLKEILNAARRSADITRQLLAFARKQTVNPKALDLNETVEGMLKMLRRLIGEDIDLAWLPTIDLWPVKIDPGQVDQILANLCVNARDAIADVGKITIETHNVTFDEAYCAEHADFVPGEFVLLAISDDGCGMDKEMLAHVFEPFFTTKDVGKGTGLGLATAYGIVKQNNGFINVYSEPGKGTAFRIYLPRHRGKIDRICAESGGEIPRGHGETVLLVEDDQAIRKMSKRMLENLGYAALEAETPDHALLLAKENAGSIDLLLTDVVMPGMNGRDLADQLHALCPDLATLFMSGYTSSVISHREVLDQGVNFIQKPFSQKDLAVKVCKALHGKSR